MLDRAGFEARLVVSSIEVLDQPDRGTVHYAAADMFMGHWVAVSFSGGEVDSVDLLG